MECAGYKMEPIVILQNQNNWDFFLYSYLNKYLVSKVKLSLFSLPQPPVPVGGLLGSVVLI